MGDFPLLARAISIVQRLKRSHRLRWLFVVDFAHLMAMINQAVDADVKVLPIQLAEHRHLKCVGKGFFFSSENYVQKDHELGECTFII